MEHKNVNLKIFFDKYNKDYFEYNPIGSMIDDLEKLGLKAKTEFPIPHVNYETTEKIVLVVENHDNILVNLYRMNSGRYEVNAYSIKLSNKMKNKP
jgi:hypothetical protein